MRIWAFVLAAIFATGCSSIDRPQIAISEQRCEALHSWALQGRESERIAIWNWEYPENVIAIRARMTACSEAGCEPDTSDLTLYEALSPYTHSLELGEFVWLLAEDCFDANVNIQAGEYSNVGLAEALVQLEGAMLEMQFNENLCVFGEAGEDVDRGCAFFRSRRAP
ncbi:hypothetical protein V0U79_13430 [Hyphobacterium sp. HN65]|uniref:Lipoprotein n=1 Tax=Hyphobacterium lacteum TaxID=3116575 RepID=A0ABU7LTY0_9PROT|nr:hypothetical protein [Hyphobacterium sp. HN65]MEE2527363.1 hypothetical protein [Hyphobacterium sp. HN65]